MSEGFIPSIGRIVHYTLTEYDANTINGRRNDARLQRAKCDDEGGFQQDTARGNGVYTGEVYPLVITRVWSTDTGCVNGQVLLDGNDTLWVTSVMPGMGERGYFEPPRVGS